MIAGFSRRVSGIGRGAGPALTSKTLTGLLLFAACESQGPETPAALDSARILGHIEVLAADSFMGRVGGSQEERRAADYVAGQFAGLGLADGASGYLQSFHVNGDPASPSQNVIGVLAGRGALADEWVIIGAHYDAVGYVYRDPPARPSCLGGGPSLPCNGADDNASGTALMIDLARVLADDARRDGASERRSIMFHAYGAEEVALVGSQFFCANPTVPLGSVEAMINLDMVGRLADGLLMVEAAGTSAAWPGLLAGANDDGLTLELDDALYPGDHYCFALAGVPAIAFFTGMHPQYHTPYDDVNLINAPGTVEVGNVVLRLARELAELPGRLSAPQTPATPRDAAPERR